RCRQRGWHLRRSRAPARDVATRGSGTVRITRQGMKRAAIARASVRAFASPRARPREGEDGMRAKTYVALVLVFATAAARLREAVADDEWDRARLIEEIDDKLGDVADKVSDARSEERSDRIEDARRLAEEVGRKVESLDGVKGDDDRARRIVDHYPDYLRRF